MTEDEMAGWHHRLDGREFEQTPGVGDGQGGLACCGSSGPKESDTTERLNLTEVSIGFSQWLSCKAAYKAEDASDKGSIPGSGKSPGEGNGHPLQYSCLENSVDRGAWQAIVHGVTKSPDTPEHACT